MRQTLSKFCLLASPWLFALALGCEAPADSDHEVAAGESALGTQEATDQCAPPPASLASNGDTQYHLYTTARTWADAQSDCVAMGGRLAVPVDPSANAAVHGLLTSPTFIGLSQSAGQASPGAGWLTVEGDAPGYTQWQPGEPNDAPGPGENDEENCAVMIASDGTWKDTNCNNLRQYVCEFGSAPVVCGGGAACQIPSGETDYRCQCPPGQVYDVENHTCYGGPLTVEVRELAVDHAGGDVFVNFPIRGTIGLQSSGNPNRVHISMGLIERPPSGANATEEELATLRSCVVANGDIVLNGDNSLQELEVRGIVPPECLGTDPQRLANVFVLIDATEEVTTEDDKFVVFNLKEAQTPLGQACTTPDPVTGQPVPGCVIDLNIKPSPGLDIALLAADPISSVGVLGPDTPHPDVPAGDPEAERPLVILGAAVAAFGRDYDDAGSETLPAAVDFLYDIRAIPDNAGVGWKPLAANPEAQHAPLDAIVPGEELLFDARLHPTPEFRNLTAPSGPWAGITDFEVRACAVVPFGENGDPMDGGPNGVTNNCRVVAITVVPGDHSSQAASSYSASASYSNSWGSSSTLKLTLAAASDNQFDVSTGAYSENYAKATMSGFFGSLTLAHGWANGYAEITSASVDGGLQVFGVSLASYSASVDADKSWSKEKCLTYSYGIVIASIDVSGCFAITAGLDVTVSVGNSSVTAGVRPYASASLSVSASLNLTLYKASLSATITILGLNTYSSDGATATLSFSRPSSSQMTIALDVYTKIRVSTLDGSIDLVVEELEANWCKKKVWGITVSYLCWSWDTLAEYTLFSYDGYSFTKTLLNRELASYTLNL